MLADPALAVAKTHECYAGKEYLVEILVAQVREYDPYAETGCCKWAYDHEDIKRTLRWLDKWGGKGMDIFDELRRALPGPRTRTLSPTFWQNVSCASPASRSVTGTWGPRGSISRRRWGQTGYMGMGVNNVVLEGAIRRLETEALPSPRA